MVKEYSLYWGEMHTHTYCGKGVFGSLEEAVEIAKTHLDFWAPSEHINLSATDQVLHPKFNWEKIKKVIRDNYSPGKFVTFPGYEWSRLEGDYNIYFLTDESPFLLPSGLEEFAEFAKENRAILIPHHTAYKVGYRGVKWGKHPFEVSPLVEIYSMHGSSECEGGPFPMNLPWMGPRTSGGTVQDALKRGIRLGFIASSDGHNAYPGTYLMGLTGVYAHQLTRESIWEALWKRRIYAVTGDRIKINFQVNNFFIGEEGKGRYPRYILAEIEGEDRLEKIEIIKDNHSLYRECPLYKEEVEEKDYQEVKVRIEWGWGQEMNWEGELSIQKGRIISLQPYFGPPPPNRIYYESEKKCSWISRTNGSLVSDWHYCRNGREGTDSIVFKIEGNPDTKLKLKINSLHFSYLLKEIMESSHLQVLEKGAKIKVHQAVPKRSYYKKLEISDNKDNKGSSFYYLRVTQRNGNMAWSSPIWIENY